MALEFTNDMATAAFVTWAETPDFANAYDWMDNDKDAGGAGDPRRGSLWGAFHAGWTAAADMAKSHVVLSVTIDTAEALKALEAFSPALMLVIAERKRQVEEEGWTAEHDAAHINGELALAAACYLAHPRMGMVPRISHLPADFDGVGGMVPELWPWFAQWWKPGGKELEDYHRRLVKGIALGLAELERITSPDFLAARAAEGNPARREALGLDGLPVDITTIGD